MTLDIYADLFDHDLDAVADELDNARTASDIAESLPHVETAKAWTA